MGKSNRSIYYCFMFFVFIYFISLSYSFKFDIVRIHDQGEIFSSNQVLNTRNHSQVLINKDIPILPTFEIGESPKTQHAMLLSMQINRGWINRESVDSNTKPWKNPLQPTTESVYKDVESDRYIILKEAYNDVVKFTTKSWNPTNPEQETESILSMPLLFGASYQCKNTYIKLDGMLSINQLALLDTVSSKKNAIITKDGKTILFNEYDPSNLGATPSIPLLVGCKTTPLYYWSCISTYILFGDEYDIYLLKELNTTVRFDHLSYYTLAPFEQIEYFEKEFFKSNEDCSSNLIPNSNPRMFYITCSKDKAYINDKRKIIHFLFGNVSFEYGDVFDDILYLNNATAAFGDNTKENVVFFNILFCKDLAYWVFGRNFFKGRTIGFDYVTNKTLIEYDSTRSFDFTSLFNQLQNNFALWIYIAASSVAVIIFILAAIMNCRSRRVLDRLFKDITGELNQKEAEKAAQKEALADTSRNDLNTSMNANNITFQALNANNSKCKLQFAINDEDRRGSCDLSDDDANTAKKLPYKPNKIK